jgi:hypothetical protein
MAATAAPPDAVAARACYAAHGIRLELSVDDARLAAGVRDVLEHFGLGRVPPTAEPPTTRLHFTSWQHAEPVPADATEVGWQDGIRARAAAGAIWLTADHHCVRLDPAAGLAEGVLPRTPSALRKDLIIYAVLLLLRRRGYYGLHASGVVADGAGCLLVAPSGSGKSTSTYGLVRQGWHYLGDDALLLHAAGDEVEALALRRDICLDPALQGSFPELRTRGRTGRFAGRGKRRLAMRELYPERLLDRCVPRLLVFPELAAVAESRLVPLGVADVLPRLVAQSAVFGLDPEAAPGHLAVLARLARQTRAYRLLAGWDLKADPERVAPLLAAVLPHPSPVC